MSARTAGSRGSSLRADRNANEERLHQCEGGMLQAGASQLKVLIKVLEVEASGKALVRLLVATGRVGQGRDQGVLRGGTGGAGTETRRSMSRGSLISLLTSSAAERRTMGWVMTRLRKRLMRTGRGRA